MEMSKIGKEMLLFQAELAKENHYKSLAQISLTDGDVRQKYLDALPEWCELEGNYHQPLFTLNGTQICSGYNRVVVGDYGAFVEIDPGCVFIDILCCKEGQEFRINDPQYRDRVKYHWLTAKDGSDCKIYFQQKEVSYADYVPGMYYVSPYEVFIDKE